MSEERQRENVFKYESMKRKKKRCITNKGGEEEMLGKMRKHCMFR